MGPGFSISFSMSVLMQPCEDLIASVVSHRVLQIWCGSHRVQIVLRQRMLQLVVLRVFNTPSRRNDDLCRCEVNNPPQICKQLLLRSIPIWPRSPAFCTAFLTIQDAIHIEKEEPRSLCQ